MMSVRAKKAKIVLEVQGYYHDSLSEDEAREIEASWDAEAMAKKYILVKLASGCGYDVFAK